MEGEYDMVIVGAGPAGSTTARFAAEAGASVLMMEKRQEIGSPVRCGEGMSKDLFPKVGIPIDKSWIASDIEGARLYSPSGHVFEIDESKAGDEVGYVIERDIFDRYLAAMAAKAGAEVVVKCSAVALLVDGGKVNGVKAVHNGETKEVRARVVVGADGFESQVGRWAGILPPLKTKDIMSCVQYRLTGLELDAKYCEFFLGSVAPGGYIWSFPKGPDSANVGIGVQGSKLRGRGEVKGYLDRWIASQPKFAGGRQLDMVAGAVSVSAPVDQTVADGIMLVGDAARQIDPITGGGIGNACQAGKVAGRVAAEAVESGDASATFLAKYDRGWRELLEDKLYRNWAAKEKLITLTDETFDKLIKLLSETSMDKLSVYNILKAVQTTYPELVKEFEDML